MMESRRTTAAASNGSGVSSDGSPVAVYRTLPPIGEPELIHVASRPHATILELGCGAGRITHELLRLGHEVVAVDNCQDMLQWVRGAETVLSDIEMLQLQRQFETVVLASHFINVAEDQRRRELLGVCRQHLAPDGVVLVQRYDPGLLDARNPSESQIGGVRIRFEIVSADFSTGRFTAMATYTIGSQCWKQEFEAQVLTDETLKILVDSVNLRLDRWLDDKRTWAILKAVRGTESQTAPLV
jgi:SAM-dependent methyltransferase